jgi:hypothetical protein
MPPKPTRPTGRSDAANPSKYREREWKRSHGAIACAECRRSVLSLASLSPLARPTEPLPASLKLKCDKSIPCSSCMRRGCASICPNGAAHSVGLGDISPCFFTAQLHRLPMRKTSVTKNILSNFFFSSVCASTHGLPLGSLVTGQGTRCAYITRL